MSKVGDQIINILEDIGAPDRAARINMLRDKMPENINIVMTNIPQKLLDCPAEHLEPSELDKLLRISFWREFERSEENGKAFSLTAALTGVMSGSNFYNYTMKDQKRMAYLIRPFVEYDVELSKYEKDGFRRLEQALSVSPILENGRLDAKVAMAQLKALEFVNIRLRGMPIKNVRNLNLNLNSDNIKKDGLTPEEIQKQLEEMKKKSIEGMMKNVGPAQEED